MFKVVTIENKKIPMRSSGMTGRIYAREVVERPFKHYL